MSTNTESVEHNDKLNGEKHHDDDDNNKIQVEVSQLVSVEIDNKIEEQESSKTPPNEVEIVVEKESEVKIENNNNNDDDNAVKDDTNDDKNVDDDANNNNTAANTTTATTTTTTPTPSTDAVNDKKKKKTKKEKKSKSTDITANTDASVIDTNGENIVNTKRKESVGAKLKRVLTLGRSDKQHKQKTIENATNGDVKSEPVVVEIQPQQSVNETINNEQKNENITDNIIENDENAKKLNEVSIEQPANGTATAAAATTDDDTTKIESNNLSSSRPESKQINKDKCIIV